MARASCLARRDDRYWVQFRFDPFRIPPDPYSTYSIRSAQREYAVALRRTFPVISLIAEFKLIPERRATLFSGRSHEWQRVEWAALERAGDRIVTAAIGPGPPWRLALFSGFGFDCGCLHAG